MYLITVIPTKRKIPDGELFYISSDQLTVGTIIDVPIKKIFEKALIIEQKNVIEAKSYIKSLPWKLVKIDSTQNKIIFKKEIIETINDFSSYAMVDKDKIVRSCFKEIKLNKNKTNNNSKKLIITNNTKDIGNFDQSSNVANYASFLSFFKEDSNINEILIDNPEKLSFYSINYLGFDATVFIVLLAKKLKIKILFNSQNTRLRYSEWKIKNKNQKQINTKNNLRIISRTNEKNEEKAYPINKDIFNVILKATTKNEKIIIISPTKNFSPKTICGDCGQTHNCPNCNNPLKLVTNNRNYAKKYGISGNYIFVCNICQNAYNSIAKCVNCDSWNLTPLGYGIDRIYENLINNINKESTIPTKLKNKIYNFSERVLQKELKKWNEQGGIIIGTLNLINEINDCDICIVPSLGALLYSENFESIEQARDILEYAKHCNHGMIVSVMQDEEKQFLEINKNTWQEQELKDRKDLHYPPYARYVIFTLDPYASKAEKIQKEIIKILENTQTILGIEIKKNNLGQIKIHTSFPTNNWSINNDDYTLPKKIANNLLPFLKYLKVEVY